MTDNWNTFKLGELVDFKTGKLNANAATPNGKYPFFTCSQETYSTDTYSFDTEAVLLGGNNANGIYPLKFFKGKFDAYQRTYVIQSLNKKILDNSFLFFALNVQLNLLRTISTGVTTKFLTKTILNNFEIKIPSINSQKKIAAILSTYDNLIENNNKRIQILEKIADIIYQEWFVKFRFPGHENSKMVESDFGLIPKGWEYKGILDIEYFYFIKGNIKKFDGMKTYLATADIDGIEICKEGIPVTYDEKPSRAQKIPVIYSAWFARMKDTFKVLGFSEKNISICQKIILSSGMAGFYSEKDVFPFLYYSINSKNFHLLKDQYATGATQIALTNSGLSNIKLIVPSVEIVRLYGSIVLPIIDEIFLIQIKNQILRQTRDLLLPKLISGKIDVTDLDIMTKEIKK